MNFRLAAALVLAGTAAQAEVLRFPGTASLAREDVSALDSYEMPVGIWAEGQVPIEVVEGQRVTQAWRIAAPSLTTLQLLRPLREQLRNDGFDILFECQTEACGGFDFRFALDVLPPPQMRVNIGDFRFLSAARDVALGREFVTLLVSRTAQAGFVQVTQITPATDATPAPLTSVDPAIVTPGVEPAPGDAPIAAQLDTVGRAVLGDLAFVTGAAQLGEGDFASLQALADYLARYPDRQVALVGHTDSTGSLDANIALSKRRAAAVLERLVGQYGVPRRQLAAEGMGYLAPVASNLTAEGREANRRVEVIVTSTQAGQ